MTLRTINNTEQKEVKLVRWRCLSAFVLGILILGALGGPVCAESHSAQKASEGTSSYEKITINGIEVPLIKTHSGIVIVGRTSKIGRGEILEKAHRLMVNRVLNKWKYTVMSTPDAHTISKSDYGTRSTTLKLSPDGNKKIKLSTGTALSTRFKIYYYEPMESIDVSVYNYAYSTTVTEYPPYITYQYKCRSIKLTNRLLFYGEKFSEGWSIGGVISFPPGITFEVSGSSSSIFIDGSFGESEVSNYDSIAHSYEGTITVHDTNKIKIYMVRSGPVATFEVVKGNFKSLDAEASVSVNF